MMRLFRYIKQHFPFLWYLIESINGIGIYILYGNRISKAVKKYGYYKSLDGYIYRPLMKSDIPLLVDLFGSQPYKFDDYFKPHNFDAKSLYRQFSYRSFYMFGVFDGNRIIGYFFIRFFINKKAFRGKMVDYEYQRRGIAKRMGIMMTNIALDSCFRLFATISRANISSIASSKAVNSIRIIDELPDNYLYVEYTKLNDN